MSTMTRLHLRYGVYTNVNQWHYTRELLFMCHTKLEFPAWLNLIGLIKSYSTYLWCLTISDKHTCTAHNDRPINNQYICLSKSNIKICLNFPAFQRFTWTNELIASSAIYISLLPISLYFIKLCYNTSSKDNGKPDKHTTAGLSLFSHCN